MWNAVTSFVSIAALSASLFTASSSYADGKAGKIAEMPQDYMKIMRVCNYDIERFSNALARPIPIRLANERTQAARHNQAVLMAKVREICASVPYWEERLTETAKGFEPQEGDLTLAAQLVYTLKLQLRYLKKAHTVYLRVLHEENERLGRIEQLEEIFVIRARMEDAKQESERDEILTETAQYIVR